MKLLAFKDTTAEQRQAFLALGRLPDGRLCAINRFIFTFGLLVGVDDFGYEDRYCYHTFETALFAFMQWQGEGDPPGWHRHPASGRRRDAQGNEWVNY